jgi:hypothetical protein
LLRLNQSPKVAHKGFEFLPLRKRMFGVELGETRLHGPSG